MVSSTAHILTPAIASKNQLKDLDSNLILQKQCARLLARKPLSTSTPKKKSSQYSNTCQSKQTLLRCQSNALGLCLPFCHDVSHKNTHTHTRTKRKLSKCKETKIPFYERTVIPVKIRTLTPRSPQSPNLWIDLPHRSPLQCYLGNQTVSSTVLVDLGIQAVSVDNKK